MKRGKRIQGEGGSNSGFYAMDRGGLNSTAKRASGRIAWKIEAQEVSMARPGEVKAEANGREGAAVPGQRPPWPNNDRQHGIPSAVPVIPHLQQPSMA